MYTTFILEADPFSVMVTLIRKEIKDWYSKTEECSKHFILHEFHVERHEYALSLTAIAKYYVGFRLFAWLRQHAKNK